MISFLFCLLSFFFFFNFAGLELAATETAARSAMRPPARGHARRLAPRLRTESCLLSYKDYNRFYVE